MKVRELLSSKKKWTKGWYARRKDGGHVASLSEEACCWCLNGAVVKCYYEPVPIFNRLAKKTEYHGR